MKRYILLSFLSILGFIISFSGCRKKSTVVGSTPYDDYPAYKGADLGVTIMEDETRFALWAPSADAAELLIYDQGQGGKPVQVLAMSRKSPVEPWRASQNGKLYGKFYTFRIHHDGKWLPETPGIWAKAVGVNGDRAAIVDMNKTNPEGWENDVRPPLKNFNDIILYEMHYRDFSVDSTSGINNRGKFLSLTETGTRSPSGQKTGIDHLKELGVTHVHLLPSYDFGSIDETRLSENKYNWGYDPKNYNVPEGSYSTDPFTPETRIKEMKQMIKALHDNGIRVIMDVVYNHTYTTENSNFNLTAPGYYYRHNAEGGYSDASACGNETASEREMMRRYIVESVKYWVNEYHVDGFRFDLMGIHDIETMNQVRKELNKIDPTIFVYGEGWAAADSPYPAEKRALKANAPKMPGIAVFNDDLRDAVKGHYSDGASQGFVSGVKGLEESVKFGIVGATNHPEINYHNVNYSDAPYALTPAQSINYVSSHDDLCLVDKLKASNPEMAEQDLIRLDKLAQTIVFTSQGVPFIFNGEEIFRTKKGVHNSYQSPDSVNAIDWENKTRYRDLFNYYQGLIALRKNHPAFRIPTSEGIRSHLHFLDTSPGVIAYMLGEHANGDSWREILVIFNGDSISRKVNIPEGNWTVVVKDGVINEAGMGTVKGGSVEVPYSSALILKR
ncbi:type I pullulanase [Coprobacter tertius]|uniref:Type I pullulanase n=1 Tax=Coprobacter tertius TaxID=2944915 RepID=A0ABT1MJA4_9BACT|nr:type I pullulanase [Coprobacter tertius]MCP9612700.1 type I pullulanase [Coprobacter tertius]